jgi:hypothetical protein
MRADVVSDRLYESVMFDLAEQLDSALGVYFNRQDCSSITTGLCV